MGLTWNGVSQLVAGGQGIFYAVSRTGRVLWYRVVDGRWAPGSGTAIGLDAQPYSALASGGDGVLYGVRKADRRLQLLTTRAPASPTGPWTGPVDVGRTWGDADIVGLGDGVLLGVTTSGDVRWYRHTGESAGLPTWADNSGTVVATGFARYAALAPIDLGCGDYALPVDKSLLARAAYTRPHHDYPALDLPVPVGTAVHVIRAGKVASAGPSGLCGLGVIVEATDGGRYVYCHLSRIDVAAGATLPTGSVLGLSGNTGHSTGPHLHVGVSSPDGAARCPQPLLLAVYDGAAVPAPSALARSRLLLLLAAVAQLTPPHLRRVVTKGPIDEATSARGSHPICPPDEIGSGAYRDFTTSPSRVVRHAAWARCKSAAAGTTGVSGRPAYQGGRRPTRKARRRREQATTAARGPGRAPTASPRPRPPAERPPRCSLRRRRGCAACGTTSCRCSRPAGSGVPWSRRSGSRRTSRSTRSGSCANAPNLATAMPWRVSGHASAGWRRATSRPPARRSCSSTAWSTTGRSSPCSSAGCASGASGGSSRSTTPPVTNDIRQAACDLAVEVEALVAQTGYERIHVVGHSLGGLIARYYVQRLGGHERVHTLVTLGYPARGHAHRPAAAGEPVPAAAARQRPVRRARGAGADVPHAVRRVLVRPRPVDLPHGNARLEHTDLYVRNVRVHGVGHMTLPLDGQVVHEISAVLSELDWDGTTLSAGITPLLEETAVPRRRLPRPLSAS